MISQGQVLTRAAFIVLVLGAAAGNHGSAEGIRLRIDPETSYQTIEGFGASDARQCAIVGKNWPLGADCGPAFQPGNRFAGQAQRH
jgi:hypothetical protein